MTGVRAREALNRDTDLDPAGPRLGTIAAGVVAVGILVGAGAVTLSGRDSPLAGPVPGPVAPVAPGPATAAPAAAPIPVPVAPVDVGPLLVAPQVNWQLFAGVPLPHSQTAGPFKVDGPVRSGYARSQTGALIAAVQIGTRYLLTPGEGWREVLDRQVLPGLGRDVFARNRADVDVDDPPGTYGQPAGFRFVAYTPDVASIQLVSRFPTTGNLQVVTLTVHWTGGDWRLRLQPDGGSSPTAQAAADLDGFVVWGI